MKRQQGLFWSPFPEHESRQQQPAYRQHSYEPPVRPAVFFSAHHQSHQPRPERSSQQEHPPSVYGARHLGHLDVELVMHHEHGSHPERHIDEKDEPPTDLVGQDSAQQRPRHRREHHRHRQIPHVAAAHSRRYQVAHDHHRQSDQPACAHPLESSQQHELPHLGHEARQP